MNPESNLGYGLLPLLDTFSSVISYIDESILEEVALQLMANILPSGVTIDLQYLENFH